jgi:hypothetical protein
MKIKKILISTVILCFSVFLNSSCKSRTKPENSDIISSNDQVVQRGKYLVSVIGCRDCHSPKRMGTNGVEDIPDRMLSGAQSDSQMPVVDKNALRSGWELATLDANITVGPWGISFAANITSDPSGIGSWPEENFIRAMKKGKYKGIEGGRTLLPPMPWDDFANCSDDDVKAIYAYLKSTRPVHNVVPLAVDSSDIK